jgi:hypothetical protein
MRRHDRNRDSNPRCGHQRTAADSRAPDLVLPHASPRLSAAAQDYGSEDIMNRHQQTALDWHCRLSVETMHPRFARRLPSGLTVVLTVNSGYE